SASRGGIRAIKARVHANETPTALAVPRSRPRALADPRWPAILPVMNASQQRAVARHRSRLVEQGLARYEVRGLAKDKELVRGIARRLAQDDPEAGRLRGEL